MDKQDVVHAYNGMLFSPKRKEILTRAMAQKNSEDIMLGKVSRSQPDNPM